MTLRLLISRVACRGLRNNFVLPCVTESGKLDSVATKPATVPNRLISGSSIVFTTHKPGQYVRIKRRAHEYDTVWNTELAAWSDRNNTVYSPLDLKEGIRPAEIHHGRKDIRYSYRKLFHLAKLIRLMNVDEAISFLEYVDNKGATIIREVLLEAKEKAAKEHIEFKSNFHIVKSFANHVGSLRFPIYRGRGGLHMGRTRFSNYYVMIREGTAPLKRQRVTAYEMAVHHLDNMRKRTIKEGL